MMTWVQRAVGAVFVIGLVALVAAVVTLVQRAEGVPPLPVYTGLLGAVVLILLAGACLALISIAISARRGAEALRRIAAQGGGLAAPVAAPARPFTGMSLREVANQPEPEPAAPARPQRPSGRTLVAER
ncbi:TMEM43 family protein [Paracoccus marinaquae]|uniref:TMEM43 family protein n=1 Tax=Paracoccus marinaquae TaxID=2841926 RepID=A0ABS6AMH5_9RHOB|nr:TMEM43 family protein [Paracoccus marinaquae]MBU3031793.1 TMEM43 family protein [Paracoccus marinaquae]